MTRFGGRKDLIRTTGNLEDRIARLESIVVGQTRMIKNLAAGLSVFEDRLGYRSTVKKNPDGTATVDFKRIPTKDRARRMGKEISSSLKTWGILAKELSLSLVKRKKVAP